MNPYSPIGNRVFVLRTDPERVTAGGIIIPDAAQERPQHGIALSVGDEVKTIEAKDEVLFGKWSGAEVVLDGQTLLIMEEKDILAFRRIAK